MASPTHQKVPKARLAPARIDFVDTKSGRSRSKRVHSMDEWSPHGLSERGTPHRKPERAATPGARPRSASHHSSLSDIAGRMRADILRSTTAAASGHPTSSLSGVELMAELFFHGHFRADLNKPRNPANDRFIISKGHASPLLYSIYAAAGKIRPAELLRLRKHGSILEGHPAIRFPYTEVPTGSLGQGLSVGAGIAEAGRLLRLPYRTFVLLGDSEMAEGSVWEAIQYAGFRTLHTLIGILDVNRLGQSGPTMLGWNVQGYARRVRAFGWNVQIIDGHTTREIHRALTTARAASKPTMIIAKTVKGKGVSFLENKNGWHGKALSKKDWSQAMEELGSVRMSARGTVRQPQRARPVLSSRGRAPQPRYDRAQPIAPRKAFGNALLRLAPAFPHMAVLDAEVMNSTYTELFAARHPRRFFQTYIAEQNMVGIATGLASRGLLPVASTYAAFFTRAFDQLRMAQYAGTHQVYVGTHAGVSIGQDGPSQMGLQDVAMFRTLENSIVLCPSDAYSTERCVELALREKGIVYLRATRAALPVLYTPTTPFRVGGSMTLRKSPRDRATIVAAGITVHEVLKAADILAERNIRVRVLDLYSIKPIDGATLTKAARETKHLITVEDHRPEGGLGEAVRAALGSLAGCVTSLAVRKTPHSGTPEQLLRYEGIDAAAMVREVRKKIRRR